MSESGKLGLKKTSGGLAGLDRIWYIGSTNKLAQKTGEILGLKISLGDRAKRAAKGDQLGLGCNLKNCGSRWSHVGGSPFA